MSDAETYARQLLVKRHGYPLWVPEPYGHSVIYRTKGVRIGDVGYVTQEGGFETLFNIRAPRDHPINRHGVPEGFEQIQIASDDIVHIPDYHHRNSAVTTATAVQSGIGINASTSSNPLVLAGAGAGFEYNWSTTEGAILHLPQGASCLTAPNLRVFRDQALKNACSWYRFATLTLGRELSNGSLYLVTGCDKTDSWMVGCFSGASAGRHLSLRLNGLGMVEGRISYSYSWSLPSVAAQRIGPSTGAGASSQADLDALERDDTIFIGDAPDNRNQCVFVRGYRISMRNSIFSQLRLRSGFPDFQISTVEGMDPTDITPKKKGLSSSGYVRTLSGHRHGQSGNVGLRRSGLKDAEPNEMMDSPPDVKLEMLPNFVEPYHPSVVINNYILDEVPEAKVVVTHDDEWGSLITDDDIVLPSDEELINRFIEKYDFNPRPTTAFQPPPTSGLSSMFRSRELNSPVICVGCHQTFGKRSSWKIHAEQHAICQSRGFGLLLSQTQNSSDAGQSSSVSSQDHLTKPPAAYTRKNSNPQSQLSTHLQGSYNESHLQPASLSSSFGSVLDDPIILTPLSQSPGHHVIESNVKTHQGTEWMSLSALSEHRIPRPRDEPPW